jgi:uncharacterized membrane protein
MIRSGWRSEEGEPTPTNRLEGLADGVFAITMTLLVLELSVPAVADVTNETVTEALREMWPEFLIYALSFLVLGAFWLMHKMIFDAIEASNPQLIWLNVAFLLITALLPFSTALVGEYRALETAAFVYGLNVFLAFAVAWAIWAYATRQGRLAVPDLDPVLVRGANRMGLIYVLVIAAAATVALISATASYLAIALVVATIITATMLGRWETVMVWARESDSKESPGATAGS